MADTLSSSPPRFSPAACFYPLYIYIYNLLFPFSLLLLMWTRTARTSDEAFCVFSHKISQVWQLPNLTNRNHKATIYYADRHVFYPVSCDRMNHHSKYDNDLQMTDSVSVNVELLYRHSREKWDNEWSGCLERERVIVTVFPFFTCVSNYDSKRSILELKKRQKGRIILLHPSQSGPL